MPVTNACALRAAVLALSIASGAVSAVVAKPQTLPTPGPNETLILVDRANSSLAMNLEFDVWIDGQSVATLGNASWTAVVVPAGPHTLSIVPAYCAGRTLEVKRQWTGGESDFFHVAQNPEMTLDSHTAAEAEQDRDRHHYSAAHGPAEPQFKFAAQKCRQ